MPRRVHERVPLPVEQAVDGVEAGHVRRRLHRRVEPAERRGPDLELEVEDVDQKQREPERRHRDRDRADALRGAVDAPAVAYGGEHAERDGDQEGEKRRAERELEARRRARGEIRADRAAGDVAIAEVAVNEPGEVVDELLAHRLVQAELLLDLVDRRRRRIGRPRQHRVPGEHMGDHEDQAERADHRQGRRSRAFEEVEAELQRPPPLERSGRRTRRRPLQVGRTREPVSRARLTSSSACSTGR
jgi:hypothetical protein